MATFIGTGENYINLDQVKSFGRSGRSVRFVFVDGTTQSVSDDDFELAEDVLRFAKPEPVIAAPPGWRAIVGTTADAAGFLFENSRCEDVIAFRIETFNPLPITVESGDMERHPDRLSWALINPQGHVLQHGDR